MRFFSMLFISFCLTLGMCDRSNAAQTQEATPTASSARGDAVKWEGYTFVFLRGRKSGQVRNSKGVVIGLITTANGELQVKPSVPEPEASRLKKSFADWKASQAEQPSVAGSAGRGGTDVNKVVAMLNAGVSEDLIVTMLRKENKPMTLEPDDVIKLKAAKASDGLIKTMMNPEGAIAGSVGPPAAGPQQAEQVAPSPAPASPSPSGDSTQQTGRLQKFWGSAKQAVKDGTAQAMNPGGKGIGPAGPKAIDAAGLRNILPDYDPNRPLGEQFPHVAITVVKAPAMWDDMYLSVVPGRGTGLFSGCFTLKAVVWASATESKTVGPFDWCSPKDVEVKPGPQYPTSNIATADERFSHYLTGIKRTDGPRPPDQPLPIDSATQNLQRQNSPKGRVGDLNMESATRLALMFMNVRKGLGQTFLSSGDFRVWIVSINQ